MVAGELEIRLMADIARLRADMDETRRLVGNTMSGVERAAGAAKAALGALGAALAGGAILAFAKNVIDAQDELSKLSQKLNISVESLVGYQHAADMSGVSNEALTKGFKSLGTQMYDASRGSAEAVKNFKSLGINVLDSSGKLKSTDKVLLEMSDSFTKMGGTTERTALAVRVLGKSGLDMIPMLKDGRQAIAEMVNEGQRLNPVTTESARQAEIYNDNLTRLQGAMGSIGVTVLNNVLPVMVNLSESFVSASRESTVFANVSKAITVVLQTMLVLGAEVAFVFRAMGTEIGGIAAQMVALSKLDFSGFSAIGKAMKEDAATARADHDKFIDLIINGNKKAAESSKNEGDSVLGSNSGKAIKEKISDYQKLVEQIAKMTAESKKQLDVGRDLTRTEKLLTDIIADRAAGTKRLTKAEFDDIQVKLRGLEAIDKQIKANEELKKSQEELKKAHEDVDKIMAASGRESDERLARLEHENSLIGKSALQVAILNNAYQIDLQTKRQQLSIDERMKGIRNPAEDAKAIADIKAASAARIAAKRAELEAEIDARTKRDTSVALKGAGLGGTEVGKQILAEQMAGLEAQARQEHANALAKIEDLNAIRAVEQINAKLKADIAASNAAYADEERQASVGRAIREEEINERIANFRKEEGNFGVTKLQFIEAEMNLLNDKQLNIARGAEENRKNAALQEQYLRSQAALELEKHELKGGQLAYDNANLQLQTDLLEIAKNAKDLDAAKIAGLEYQKKNSQELIMWLAKQASIEKKALDTGALAVDIDKERVEVNKKILEIKERIGTEASRAAKAEIDAKAAEEKQKAAVLLTAKIQNERWAGMVTNMENDFHIGMLRLLEGGKTTWAAAMKSFGNSFKVNVIEQMYKFFAKPIVFKAIMSLAGVVGANGLATAAGKELDAIPGISGSGFESTQSWMTAGKALWDGLSGGFAAFGDKITGALLNTPGVSVNTAMAGGTAASYLGAGLAGVTIGTFIAGDKTLLGMSGMTTSVLGSALTWALAPALGPMGLFLGGIAGGALNALFGRGPKQYGETTVKGSFSGSGFDGLLNTPWTQKGGLFRSNKEGNDTQPLSEEAQGALNAMTGAAGSAFAKLITISGDAARSVEGWAFAIDQSIKDGDDLKKVFGLMADSMGTFVIPELEKFRAEGENLADTAVKMADIYFFTETIFKLLGNTTAETGIASLGMRDNLVKLMGGMQAASATMESYYKNFYTAEEQQANNLAAVNKQFEMLGIIAPRTREEFRSLSETLVRDTTPAGQELFAAFMKLNPAFAAVTQSTEDLAAAALNSAAEIQAGYIDAARQAVAAAFSAVQAAVKSERDLITETYQNSLVGMATSISTVNASVSKLASLSGALKTSLAGIRAMPRAEAQAQIATALLLARTGGIFPTAESLSDALQSIAQPSEKLFRNFVDFQRDQILTGNDIEKLAKLTDGQLSVEQKTLAYLDDVKKILDETFQGEMSRLDEILASAQAQIDAMNGVNTSVLSIADALRSLTAAIVNFNNQSVVPTGFQSGMGITNNNGLLVWADTAGAATNNGLGGSSVADTIARRNALRNPAVSPVITAPSVLSTSAPQGGFGSGSSFLDLIARAQAGDQSAIMELRRQGVPGYANGGMFSGGARIVGERGPEIEFTGPSRISSNQASKQLLDLTPLIEENKKLRAEVKALMTSVAFSNAEIAKNTNRFASRGTAENPMVTA